MKRVSYQLWDVFSRVSFRGNALAVVPDAKGLSDDEMQAIAKEFNLSETSFVFPSSIADYQARFFTPTQELPFAGHPSIGTAYALHHLKRIAKQNLIVRLEVGARVIPLGLEKTGRSLGRVWMHQGVPKLTELDDKAAWAASFDLELDDLDQELPIYKGSAGLSYIFLPLRSIAHLKRFEVSKAMLTTLDEPFRAVFAYTRHAPVAQVRARMFSLEQGVVEDAATGSAHGPLGAILARHGVIDLSNKETIQFVSHQGLELGRASEILVNVARAEEDFEVYVGGQSVLVGEGTLYL